MNPVIADFETPVFALVFGVGLLALSVALAWNVRKLQKTAADYYLAGRAVGILQNASAISGDYISAASFLGISGLTFLFGFDGLYYAVGFFLGFVVVLFFIAGPLRKFGQYTIPDFVGGRFHTNEGRAVAVLCVLVISLFYTAPQMLGAAKILLILTHLPYAVAVAMMSGSITLYVVLGGMRAATMIQIFQFWVLWCAIFLVALLVWQGGLPYDHVVTEIQRLTTQETGAIRSQYMSPAGNRDLRESLSLLFALVCGTAGLPHILVRLYTNPDRARARWSVLLVLLFIGTFYLMTPYIGIAIHYLFLITASGAPAGTEGLSPQIMHWLTFDGQNLAVPAAAMRFGGELALGIAVAGSLGAVLSTTAGLLVVMSGALGHDLYYSLYNPKASQRARVLVARGSTVVMGIVVFLLGLAVERMQIAVLVGLAFAISASTLFPVLILGLWWRRMTGPGAIAGMVTGLGVSLFLIFGKSLLPVWLRFENPGGVSVAASFLAIVVASKVFGRVPDDVDRFMALVHGTSEEQRIRRASRIKRRKVFAGLPRR
ncbi:MAG TPA: cation acetate symporter [Thermoleophilia bacterium]|nr:cation acetate symporter [Thermoleophilia bacterium]